MTDHGTLSVRCDLRFVPRDEDILVLHLQAAHCAGQTVRDEELSVSVSLGAERLRLSFESHVTPENNRLVRVLVPVAHMGKDLIIAYRASVSLHPTLQDPANVMETPLRQLPFSVQPYLLASRYCQSDRLGAFAEQEFGHLLPGHSRVTAICNWIRGRIRYADGSSNTQTTAHDTMEARVGVCRDFAHLAISLCRALNIPARFVSAYSAGIFPQDFHALVEVYLSGRWYLFDPTRLASVDRAARIGVGRDAADVSFATIYGAVETTIPKVDVQLLGASVETPLTLQAVSISET
ncbi:MAG TPA: transglutaminase family protein [Alphaproteobacteria bacterium]|jgi:transglutaminase-like putative cysteine protease